jgi:hypothetical protein
MKLFELFTADDLRAQIDAAMVKRTPDPTGRLFILNYTKRAQYTPELWSRVTDQCRGLIVDAEDNVVARSFEKFWNLDDPRHPETLTANLPSSTPLITRKMDGRPARRALARGHARLVHQRSGRLGVGLARQ